MGLTSALNTSLNGLALNETTIDVLGNNIANANTTGFKASKVQFATQLSRTLSVGSRPSTTDGGTNPKQIGLGANVSAIVKDFGQGSITNSTSPADLAIEGDGFFILDGNSGDVYTRNGNFTLNSASTLVNADGLRVQGYGIDEDFNLVTTQLTDIQIPLGELNVAERTSNVELNGALYPGGTVADNGALITSDAMTDTTTGSPATVASLLADLEDTGANPLFPVGETVTVAGRKGGRSQTPQTLTVSATSTLQDLVDLMQGALGIHSGGTIPTDGNTGGTPGVTITAAGEFQILGNRGTANDISLSASDLTVSNGNLIEPTGLNFEKTESAIGESTVTDFVVYDSLGEPLTVRVSAYLESNTPSSTTYRYFFESDDDSDLNTVLGDGTITFDGNGQLVGDALRTFSIDRNSTAAISPMDVQVDFSNISGLSAGESVLGLESQNGSAPGTLTSFVTDETGIINGIFDNGVIRTLGQVTLARFSNTQGLIEAGGTNFLEGVASGPPFVVTPGSLGAGTVRSGSIELSNTDVGRNLVDLIVASTNYRGNARVIGSVQTLVDELLVLGR